MRAKKRGYVLGAIALLAVLLLVIGILAERNRQRRAEIRRLIAEFEEALAELRRIQAQHPNDAYDHVPDFHSNGAEDWGPYSRLHLVIGPLAHFSKKYNSVEAVPMLRRVAHGSARDGTLERLIRLLAIAGLTMRDPEDAADLAPWVGQVLEESIQEVRREMDREARENRAYHGHDEVANLALDVLGAMGSHAGPAAPIVADVATGPPLMYDPVEDYDLRIEAQLALETIGKAAVPK